MKKKILLVMLLVLGLSTLSVNAMSKEEIKSNARLYEKSIEAKQGGTLEWYPFAEGDFDAEYGEEFQLGESDTPESYTYFYDEETGYLIQYFNLDKNGIMIWKDEVPLDYEEFN